jgi:hypothetical protein
MDRILTQWQGSTLDEVTGRDNNSMEACYNDYFINPKVAGISPLIS